MAAARFRRDLSDRENPVNRPSLRDAWDRHLRMPFPPSSRNARLGDVHVDLVDYDGYIAGIVTHLLDGITPVHVARPNLGLRSQLAHLLAELEGEPLVRVNEYLAYLDHVEELAAIACMVIAEPPADDLQSRAL